MAVPVLFLLETNIGFSFSSSAFEDGFHWSKTANFNQNNIIGRSSPLVTYSNSGPRELDVSIVLVADMLGKDIQGPQNLDDAVSCFEALTFPVEPGWKPPTLCKVTLGTYSGWQACPCVCETVSPHYGTVPVWSEFGGARFAEVGLKFMGIEIDNIPASKYIKGAGQFKMQPFYGTNYGPH